MYTVTRFFFAISELAIPQEIRLGSAGSSCQHMALMLFPASCGLQVGLPATPALAPSFTPRCSAVRAAVDDKVEVKDYFNNEGFNRWSRIYSEDGEVNSVQLDIRTGHAQTVDEVLAWVDADGSATGGETFCDAGCGVGSLALPLAERGATVSASDISAAMVEEASKRAADAGLSERASFATSDLEAIEGSYDTVTCIDVMIHYPEEKMAEMVSGLASKANRRLIISFAPDTWYYKALKSFGELFPGAVAHQPISRAWLPYGLVGKVRVCCLPPLYPT